MEEEATCTPPQRATASSRSSFVPVAAFTRAEGQSEHSEEQERTSTNATKQKVDKP